MARGRILLTAAVLTALSTSGLAVGTASAVQPPHVVRVVKKLALQANRGVRLEEGRNVQAGEANLWLMPSSQFWQLQPSSGSVLPTDGVISKRGPWGCKAARWGTPAGSSPLRAGAYYCVMTRTGDYAEVKIDQVTPTRVVISYTLWRGL